jgi:putative endonuclease
MVDIYVLECEGGNIYVGKTDNGEKRLKQHLTGKGAKWTQKHKPKRILDYYRNKMDIDEKKITERMMKKHGARKVRGGPYVKTKMTKSELRKLEKKVGFKSSPEKKPPRKKVTRTYRCGKCGREGHNRTQCYAKSTTDGDSITTNSWVYRPKKTKKTTTRTKRITKKPKSKFTFIASGYKEDSHGRLVPKKASDYSKGKSTSTIKKKSMSTKKKSSNRRKKTTSSKGRVTRRRSTGYRKR